ncbi:MAG: type II toxin-antitoxin system prevent-host-death family antitoxin [Spirochaetaceae bacterium]|nr:MAG: type II toxin-antitoxin system prevent-host-death family antitoxin [Spirochaetaceae bacterium]
MTYDELVSSAKSIHFETQNIYKTCSLGYILAMKTISIRDLKAHWAEVERQVRNGEVFEVLNRGRPAAMIVPPRPRAVLKWDNHLATAVENTGKKAEEVIEYDREERW